MLVRFLSFAASVIGTRRYRPILLSLAAVILSTASIAAVASVLDGRPHQAASASQESDTKTQQQAASGLDGLDRQTPHDESAEAATPETQQPATNNDGTKPAGNSAVQPTPAPELVLNTASVTLSGSTQTAIVQIGLSDKSTATWTVTSDTPNAGITANVENANSPTPTLRLKLEQNASPGTYQLTLNSKDTARGLDLSKKITVVVTN
jgi:hypothetical protein